MLAAVVTAVITITHRRVSGLVIHTPGRALALPSTHLLEGDLCEGSSWPTRPRRCGQTRGVLRGALSPFLSLVSLLLILRSSQQHVVKKDAIRNKVCYELFYLGLIIGTKDRIIYKQEAAGR